MHENWIVEQTKCNISQWDKSLEEVNSEDTEWNQNAKEYFNRVCVECNFLDSIEKIDWNKYISVETKILDLGCGGGWLSAYLSKFNNVKSILALDTSKNYLFNIMPGVIDILNGISNKIIPVEAMFSPLLIPSASLDIVVASAAIHHADNLENLLIEISEKLKKDGYLIILNETPQSQTRYILRLLLAFSKIFLKNISKIYQKISPKISASGFEYDAYLGDRTYPVWYWEQALSNAGFQLVKLVDSNLPTVKNTKDVTLKHMICKKI